MRQLERMNRLLLEDLKAIEMQRKNAISTANKLQLLSKTQTAILRANFTSKIKQRDNIIDDLFATICDKQKCSSSGRSSSGREDDGVVVVDTLIERWKKLSKNTAGMVEEGEMHPEAFAMEITHLKLEVSTT